jgi:hypothetical protein
VEKVWEETLLTIGLVKFKTKYGPFAAHAAVGRLEGAMLEIKGEILGEILLGETVMKLGTNDGALVFDITGKILGRVEGLTLDSNTLGKMDGKDVGLIEGIIVGTFKGTNVGILVGFKTHTLISLSKTS